MAQPNKTVSLLIKDAKGQQQILQVMQSPNIKSIIKDEPMEQNYSQVVQKFSPGQKYITLNNSSRMVINTTATSRSVVPTSTKTIVRLSPQQVGQMKLISSPSSSQSLPFTKSIPVQQMPQSTYTYEIPSTSASVPVKQTPYIPSNSNSTATKKTSQSSSSQIHTPASRRRKTDKIGRGLRHFSMKVCEKVKEKGTTTYNEVADELVAEETGGISALDPGAYDQKNIRRRVYDALNVLMAMNIISKEKKEIRWHGLPTNTIQEVDDLEKENEKLRERVEMKQQQLRELILQHVAFKSLVQRNKDNEDRGVVPSPSSAIQLPFIIVNTDKKTHINCSISNDKSEYSFKFDDTFEIHDDMEVLKRMGLLSGLDRGTSSDEDIVKIKAMVPKALEKYIDAYGRGNEDEILNQDWDDSSSTYQGLNCDESMSMSMSYDNTSASYSYYGTSEQQYEEDDSDDGV